MYMDRNPKNVLIVLISTFLLPSFLFSIIPRKSPSFFWSNHDFEQGNTPLVFPSVLQDEDSHPRLKGKEEKTLLGGLLPEGFDAKSCWSRYQSGWNLKRKPSQHLISKLRGYEEMHKRCAPGSQGYERALTRLNSGYLGKFNNHAMDCKYVVWMTRDGMGNRIVSLISTFLYALLTNRVILVHDLGQAGLFCEPFPESTWLVPKNLPLIDSFANLNKRSNMSYGNMLKNGNGSILMGKYGWVYLHVVSDHDQNDQRQFCDDRNQVTLQDVPWHVLQSNLYFAPSFFLMLSHQNELDHLFPEKDTVFHFLGRYLLHPSNSVWRTITNYYNHFLANADERIGIQVRIFNPEPDLIKRYMDQILSCAFKENLLPFPLTSSSTRQINSTNESSRKSKVVLVTSLSSRYSDTLKQMYKDSNMTTTREVVRVFQPTHEVEQHTELESHNMKAWAEMYLLSLMDKLVTSSKSTFGYVPQGLGGLRPWILYRPENFTGDPNLSCQRVASMEPCFHAAPGHDCETRDRVDLGRIFPYVRHCEDVTWDWGLKLFGNDGDS